jgi:hypothetical protein
MRKQYIVLIMILIGMFGFGLNVEASGWEPTGKTFCEPRSNALSENQKYFGVNIAADRKVLIGNICVINTNSVFIISHYTKAWFKGLSDDSITITNVGLKTKTQFTSDSTFNNCPLDPDTGAPIDVSSLLDQQNCPDDSHNYIKVLACNLQEGCYLSDGRGKVASVVAKEVISIENDTDPYTMKGSSQFLTNPKSIEYECDIHEGDFGQCVTDHSGLIMDNRLIYSPLTGSEPQCRNGKESVSSPACKSNCVCFLGGAIDKDILDTVGPEGAKVLQKCGGLPDQQTSYCYSCLAKNFKKDGSEYISSPEYTFSSSIGCIPTSIMGVVTRLFQIGIGVGGGIAIIRIIQGALMRQTNDPAKIQEGTQIIFTTFVAIAMLLASIYILRIIGVDVLNLFTGAQFDAIVK